MLRVPLVQTARPNESTPNAKVMENAQPQRVLNTLGSLG